MYLKHKVNVGKGWSSHMWMLYETIINSSGTVIEFGCGIGSTPFLHWMCKGFGRKLITYESEEQFYLYAKQFQSKMHRIVKVNDWMTDVNIKDRAGVILIDHAVPQKDYTWGYRGRDVVRFKDSAEFLVLHDTEEPDTYGYTEEMYSNFKYRFDWKECRPWATVLSNFKDLKNL